LVTPTTWLSVVCVLFLSFLCLGSWANTYKKAGPHWRFELYSFDFALGALVFAIVAAFTLGTFGADLGFLDRMLVAGRTNQVLAVFGGGVFALGNMLLLATIALVGMSAAFPLCLGFAAALAALLAFKTATALFSVAAALLLLLTTVLAALAAARSDVARASVAPVVSHPPVAGVRQSARPSARRGMPNSTKGIITGVISGLSFGVFLPVIDHASSGEFGLGPYAGLLMVSIGLALATLVFNIYFMNIAIEGGPITFNAYFKGTLSQHLLGWTGGIICTLGLLALGLALEAPPQANVSPLLKIFLPLASVPLAILFGLAVWKEFARAVGSGKSMLLAAAALFLCGAVLLGLAGLR
jgi:glucose uptake protein